MTPSMRLLALVFLVATPLPFVACHPYGERAEKNEVLYHSSMSNCRQSSGCGVATSVNHVVRVAPSYPQKYTRPVSTTTSTTRFPKYVRTSTTALDVLHQTFRVSEIPRSTTAAKATTGNGEITPAPVLLTVFITSTPPTSTPPVFTGTATTNLRTWYSGTPSEFLLTQTWTAPSAPPCTAGPQPSTITTVKFDDIPVTWWYALVPTHYAGLHLRNTFIMDSRIIDLDWAEVPVSKPNFVVHPGYKSDDPNKMGDFDHSGFITLPDGTSFDVVSLWVQCDRPCELHFYELGFGPDGEHELLLATDTEPGSPNEHVLLPGGLRSPGMKLLDMETVFGKGAGTKLRWLRYWARDINENPKEWLSPAREIAVAIDDLVLRRRTQGTGCMEPKV